MEVALTLALASLHALPCFKIAWVYISLYVTMIYLKNNLRLFQIPEASIRSTKYLASSLGLIDATNAKLIWCHSCNTQIASVILFRYSFTLAIWHIMEQPINILWCRWNYQFDDCSFGKSIPRLTMTALSCRLKFYRDMQYNLYDHLVKLLYFLAILIWYNMTF